MDPLLESIKPGGYVNCCAARFSNNSSPSGLFLSVTGTRGCRERTPRDGEARKPTAARTSGRRCRS